MKKEPLSKVISDRTRDVETQIVEATVEQALKLSALHQYGEEFRCDLVGYDEFDPLPSDYQFRIFQQNVNELAQLNGLSLYYADGGIYYFIARKPR